MDLRVLQAFVRIAELGSFARAAAVLNQTQPTISRQMAALEREVGVPLFVRQRRGVALSHAGVMFRERAAQVLRSLDQAKAEISAQADVPTGTVSLGLPPSLLSVFSSPVVDRFARRYRQVLLHVDEAISQDLEALMRREEVDLAVLIPGRERLRNVVLSPLASEPLMLAGPADAKLDPRKAVSIDRLDGLPLLIYRAPNYFRLAVETALRRRGLAFNVAVELETLPLMLALIERGLGYTVMPSSGLAGYGGRIATAPVRGLSVTWTLAVNRDRAPRPAVRALSAVIRGQADALIESGTWQAPRRR